MNNSIKFVELYEKASASRTASSWCLREVVINPHYVVTLRPDERAPTLLREGKLPVRSPSFFVDCFWMSYLFFGVPDDYCYSYDKSQTDTLSMVDAFTQCTR